MADAATAPAAAPDSQPSIQPSAPAPPPSVSSSIMGDDNEPLAPAYEGISKQITGVSDQNAQLGQSVTEATNKSPDDSRKVIDLQMRTGLPPDMIERNLDSISQAANQKDFDPEKFRESSPIVADWMAQHPVNAAAASDDLGPLTRLEHSIAVAGALLNPAFALSMVAGSNNKYGRAAAGGFVQMGAQVLKGAPALYQAVQDQGGPTAPAPTIATYTDNQGVTHSISADPMEDLMRLSSVGGAKLSSVAKGLQPAPGQENLGTSVAAMGGGLLPFLASEYFTGGAATPFLAATQGAGSESDIADQAKAPQDKKDEAVLMNAGMNAMLMRVGLGRLIEKLPPQIQNTALRWMADKGLTFGEQAGINAAMTGSQNLITQQIINPKQSLTEGLAASAETGGTTGAIIRTILQAVTHTHIANTAQQTSTLSDLMDAASNSKLRQSVPAAFESLVSRMKSNGAESVYIPADKWTEHFQSKGVDPADAAQQITGDPTAYAEASATGGDLAIPMERFASRLAPTSDGRALQQHMRLSPDDLTPSEVQGMKDQYNQAQKDFDAMVKESTDWKPSNTREEQAYNTISDDIGGQLQSRFEAGTSEKYADLFAKSFVNQAVRAGRDPIEEWSKYDVKIQNEVPEVLKGGAFTDTELDPMIDQLRKGEIPTEEQAYGPSLLDFLRSKGGVQDQGGELSALDAHLPGRPFQRRLVNPEGMTQDEAAEQAHESGYIDEANPNVLLDRVRDELGGNKLYSNNNFRPHVANRLETLRQLGDYLEQMGMHPNTSDASNAAIKDAIRGEYQGVAENATPDKMAAQDTEYGQGADDEGNPVLTPDELGVAQRFEDERKASPDGLVSEYIKRFGHVVSADNAKDMSPEYDKDKESRSKYAAAVHDTGSTIAKAVYKELLREPPPAGKEKIVQFTAGGTGAGKTTGLGANDAGITYDGNMSNFKSADGKIQEALDQGWDVRINYVFSDLVAAWDRVLSRAERQGRTVPVSRHFAAHESALQVVKQMQQKYADNPRVKIFAIDNTGGKGEQKEMSIGDLPETVIGNRNETYEQIKANTERRYAEESISQRVYEGSGIYEKGGGQDQSAVPGQSAEELAGRQADELEYAQPYNPALDAVREASGRELNGGDVGAGRLLDSVSHDMHLMNPIKLLDRIHDSTGVEPLYKITEKSYQVARAAIEDALKKADIQTGIQPNDGRNMYAVHNLTAENLLHADKIGGLAVPSLGIARIDRTPFENFGEISLLADKGLIDPRATRTNKVFNADVYSPRYPQITYRADWRAVDKARSDLKATAEKIGAGDHYSYAQISQDDIESKGKVAFENNPVIKYEFLESIGKEPKIAKDENGKPDFHTTHSAIDEALEGREDQFSEFIDKKYMPLIKDEKIFNGFSDQGNRRYLSHNLDAVVRILKKDTRGGENFFYGGGSVRAMTARQFTSLKELQASRDNIKSSAEAEKFKEEVDDKLISLGNELRGNYRFDAGGFGYMDDFGKVLQEIPTRGMKPLDEAFKDLSEKQISDVREFLNSLRDAPTEYFEAKLNRAVGLDEFSGAVVPKDTRQSVLDTLQKHGIKTETYDKSIPGDRAAAVNKFQNLLFQTGKRGSIRFSVPDVAGTRRFTITLSKDANLSTFIHETGHFFLEHMGDLASDPNAPEQIKNDYQATLKWLGAADRAGVGEKQHEQFARGFEAYVMEGKAPSIALQGVFARMRAWMVGIYKNLRSLNVSLTNEVRGVFDRMIASDQEIDAAHKVQQYQPLFENAEQAGMTPAEFARYQASVNAARESDAAELRSRVMEPYNRERAKDYAEKREKIRQVVTQEINQRPEYQALQFLQKGTLVDGSPLPKDIEAFKLNRGSLESVYGKEFVKRLPRAVTSKDGVDQDYAAHMFGYTSGDELVKALVNTRPKAQLIDAMTDDRTRAQFGDPMMDGSVPDLAQQAVHSPGRAEIMMRELTALNKKAKQPQKITSLQVIKSMAQRVIGDKSVRAINPNIYRQAESKAGRLAYEAAMKGDADSASSFKRQQLLNHELYRAATAAKSNVEKIVAYMGKFSQKDMRAKIGKAGADYQEQIDGILNDYSFAKISNKAVDKRKALAAWAAEQEKAGNDIAIPDKMLTEAGKIHYKDLSYEDLQGVRDTVGNIAHMALFKGKLLANAKMNEMQDALDYMSGSIEANHTIKDDPPKYSEQMGQRFKDAKDGYIGSMSRMEFLFHYLDGDKAQGPVWQTMFKPFADAENAEYMRKRSAIADNEALFSAYTRNERALWHVTKEFIPEVKESFNKASLLALALHMGNDYSHDAVLKGFHWSEDQLQAALSHLDKRDWDLVQGMWDHLQTYWPDIEKMYRQTTGVSPLKVEAAQVVTPHGTYRGGYYPLKFNDRLSQRQMELNEAENAQNLFGQHWASAMTRNGFTKARTNSGGKPPLLSLSTYTEHIENVIKDLTHRPALIDAVKMVNHPEFKRLVEGAAGKQMYRELKPWLRAMAMEHISDSSGLEPFMARARAGATMVNMGFKVSTGIYQLSGLTQSIARIGGKYTLKGIQKFVAGVPWVQQRDTLKWIMDNSEAMKHRFHSYDREVRAVLEKDELGAGSTVAHMSAAGFKPADQAIAQARIFANDALHYAMYHIGYADMMIAAPTWMGAYMKAMDGQEENVPGGDHGSAVDYADSMTRMSQPTSGAKDMPRIMSNKNQFMKMFTMFYSYWSITHNMMMEQGRGFRAGNISGPRAAAALFSVWITQALVGDLMVGRGPDKKESWAGWAGRHIAEFPMDSFIGIRDAAHYGMEMAEGRPGDFEFTPVADAFAKPVQALYAAYKELAPGQHATRSDLQSQIIAAGYWLPAPGRQMWITGAYVHDLLTGEQRPGNLMQLARGLMYGPKHDK